MLTTEERLQDWLSRRRVLISKEQAKYIVNMIRNDIQDNWYTVTKSRFTYNKSSTGSWETLYTEQVHPEKAAKILCCPPKKVEGFYKFTIISPGGLVYEIYTIKDQLF